MGINFSSGNTLMPQHFLYRPEIRAIFDQVGSKAMPERMRVYIFLYTCFFREFFNNQEKHDPAHSCASFI